MQITKNWIIGLFIVFFVCVEIYFNFFSQKTIFSAIPPLEKKKITCPAQISNNSDELIVFVTDASMGLEAMKHFCQSKSIAKQYGNISLIIGQSDYDTFKYINYGIADLALMKDHIANAFNASAAFGLQQIGSYSDYQAFFIAKQEKPELVKEYFLDKKIGLLDYPSSRSGHIAPKSAFQSLNLNENALSLYYYNSHSELREKLISGEVDVIASYWSENDSNQLSKSYITEIKQTYSGVRWYLKNADKNPDLLCAIQNAVEKAGKAIPSSYYISPQWVTPCQPDEVSSL
ncbi:hypothetical protein J3L16_02470 [Alteromonas sp. 5E99-2]|uniref:hypothetical protein n=1 Tax=Alteromonas sp. 5E99-2 TaxID=2817683 RepID=UPI001A98A3CA|nr:hypothetical protein [Alteromonas sp. 5E99-2]MBO1254548.1 hypothetical protein [Alteromonas sp. 5E99-2]